MEIIDIARTLGEKLADSKEYKNFCETRDICKANLTLKAKLDEFKVQKSLLDIESEKEDKDENIIDVISARVETLYKEISDDPQLKAYNKAEEDLNLLMTAINMTITSYISPENLASDAGESLSGMNDDGCTHDCSTCHGCH